MPTHRICSFFAFLFVSAALLLQGCSLFRPRANEAKTNENEVHQVEVEKVGEGEKPKDDTVNLNPETSDAEMDQPTTNKEVMGWTVLDEEEETAVKKKKKKSPKEHWTCTFMDGSGRTFHGEGDDREPAKIASRKSCEVFSKNCVFLSCGGQKILDKKNFEKEAEKNAR